ncbi:MAG TPA: transglycosylase SLT domain-containing protein [Vicinamibacterales bacterium]|nr:transglycosylase SLT domain-containing protein [Vicinamibacterales bacterium]
MSRVPVVAVAAILLLLLPWEASQSASQLGPTTHASVGGALEDLWLVPSEAERHPRKTLVYKPLEEGVDALGAGDYAKALSLVTRRALAGTELASYAEYYTGLAQMKLARAEDARSTFESIRARKPRGYLSVAAALGQGEAAEALGDFGGALEIYTSLAADTNIVNEDVLARVGRASLAAGDRTRAARAFGRIYYEYPLSDAATEAATQLQAMQDVAVRGGVEVELGRAARLFGAGRYTDALTAYTALGSQVTGDDRELVELRIAESDYFLGRHAAAISALTPWLSRGARQAEARFFHLSALRGLRRHDESIAQTRALVNEFPDSSWSEEALNNLGTYYILENEDGLAAQTFRELFEKFPTGTRAERAAWKHGWWSYKNGEHAETIRVFESAAKTYPRSNYRPSFLYWAGRAHARLGAAQQAQSRLRLVLTDYGNSYYGRLALQRLPKNVRTSGQAPIVSAGHATPADTTERPPTTRTIQSLLAAGLYDDAINELRFAQRAWGTSPALEATIAWAYNRNGELRRAITLMRRAYPQHLTGGGAELPTEILEVIFPLTYWDLIRKYSAAHDLDPYLIAALIGQESTFDPKIRSAANAWGLMQIVPATGRRLSRSLGIRRFHTAMLTNPTTNVRLGTLYFSRLVQQFGGTHYALASYNAGENRVVRWKAERPGVDEDEFIDDIPFPETQNYVKRILGTAEDYRALYGKGGGGRPIPVTPPAGR